MNWPEGGKKKKINFSNLKESGWIGFFQSFDAKLDEGRRVLEVGRAGGHLFPQAAQLQVAFPAGEIHQGFFSAA